MGILKIINKEADTKIISEQILDKYKLITYSYDVAGTEIKEIVAFTLDDKLIGSPRIAHWICDLEEALPEPLSKDSDICHIAFSEKTQKWYYFVKNMIGVIAVGHDYFKPGKPDDLIEISSLEEAKEHAIVWAKHYIEVYGE